MAAAGRDAVFLPAAFFFAVVLTGGVLVVAVFAVAVCFAAPVAARRPAVFFAVFFFAPVAAFAVLSAVRSDERCARLRAVAARVLRIFFFADAILGTGPGSLQWGVKRKAESPLR